MSRVRFQRVGQVAGASYPTNPLTDIRQVVEPPAGAHRDFLTTLGWPFAGDEKAAYRTTRLSQTYFDLLDAGILGALDWLFVSNGRSVAGSLVNWITGKPNAGGESSDLVIEAGALKTDGAASFLSHGILGSHRQHYQGDSASAFAFATVTPPAPTATSALIGSVTSGRDYLRLHRNSGSPFQQIRMNSSAQVTLTPTQTAAMWRGGCWGVNRAGTDVSLMRDGAVLATGTAATEVLPDVVAIGRGGTDGATYVTQSVTAFGGGRALTGAEWADLNAILVAHSAEMQALAA